AHTSAASHAARRDAFAAQTSRGCCGAPDRGKTRSPPAKSREKADAKSTSRIIEVMPAAEEALARLAGIPNLTVSRDMPLANCTRFGIGGPADVYAETGDEEVFITALAVARESGLPMVVIGGGTNLIVSDDGFRGVVLRFRGEILS